MADKPETADERDPKGQSEETSNPPKNANGTSKDTDGTSKSSLKPLLWILFFAITLLVFPESVIVISIGLIPTFVAFIVDKSSKKYATFSVGAMNIAGIFPAIVDLWAGQNNISQAVQIITNAYDLVIIYGAAGCGWILYVVIQFIVNALISMMAKHRINLLQTKQQELIDEWGEDIKSKPGADAEEISEDEINSTNPSKKTSAGTKL